MEGGGEGGVWAVGEVDWPAVKRHPFWRGSVEGRAGFGLVWRWGVEIQMPMVFGIGALRPDGFVWEKSLTLRRLWEVFVKESDREESCWIVLDSH